MSADFIDSNVFLYLFDETDMVKCQTAEDLIRAGLESGTATISFQVVQEILNVVTRKLRSPATLEESRRLLSTVLVPMWSVMPTQQLYERALDIHVRYQFHFYDALIVAAALTAGCTRLYSEDLQHGQQIEGLMVENPFR